VAHIYLFIIGVSPLFVWNPTVKFILGTVRLSSILFVDELSYNFGIIVGSRHFLNYISVLIFSLFEDAVILCIIIDIYSFFEVCNFDIGE